MGQAADHRHVQPGPHRVLVEHRSDVDDVGAGRRQLGDCSGTQLGHLLVDVPYPISGHHITRRGVWRS